MHQTTLTIPGISDTSNATLAAVKLAVASAAGVSIYQVTLSVIGSAAKKQLQSSLTVSVTISFFDGSAPTGPTVVAALSSPMLTSQLASAIATYNPSVTYVPAPASATPVVLLSASDAPTAGPSVAPTAGAPTQSPSGSTTQTNQVNMTGLIVGCVVGGVIFVAAILWATWYYTIGSSNGIANAGEGLLAGQE